MGASKPTQSRSTRSARLQRRWLLPLLVLGAWVVLGARLAGASDAPAFRIVVHPSNVVRTIDKSFLADAFLKKITRWDSGETIRPLDQSPAAPVRRAFSMAVLKRTVTAVRSYWQQRIFSGRDVPPPELDSDESVIAYVERNPGAIGYVSGAAKLGSTRELQLQ